MSTRPGPASVLGAIRAAGAMLTRLPLGPSGEMGTGAAAFPLIGAAMGAVAALPIVVLAPRDAFVAAALSVAVLAMFGGALHLDGLADCADYLAAPDPSSAERARRDPRVGAAGVAAVSLVLIVQVACLAALAGTDRWLAASALIAGCTASRATVATLARWVAHRREGLGAWFAEGTSAAAAATSAAGLVVVVGVAALAGRTVLPVVAALIAVAVGTVALVGLARVQSGATGDAYGAAIELGLTAGLVTAAVVRP